MCSVKTVESVPSVWRIWYRERPSPDWPAFASTTRGMNGIKIKCRADKLVSSLGTKRDIKSKLTGQMWWFPELTSI